MSIAKQDADLPTKEEVLENEDALLDGLLAAAKFKEDVGVRRLIRVTREGNALFEFHIRPLSEEEIDECHKGAAKYAPSPVNREVRVEIDVDYVRLRSLKIYTATVPEDRRKLWDSKTVQKRLNVLTAVDVINTVLMAGEKDSICDEIDALSGYNRSLVAIAKN